MIVALAANRAVVHTDMSMETPLTPAAPTERTPSRVSPEGFVAKSQRPEAAFVAQARVLVKDLFTPSPAIYWADLLITSAIAYSGFFLAHRHTLHPAWRAAAFLVSCLAFYRAALFTHELVHLGSGAFKRFRIGWNILTGIPLLIPSFLYYTHLEHHRPKHYATHHDGEYLPLARGPWWTIVMFVVNSLWIPALTVVRFLILTPLCWTCRPAREWIHRSASALVIDPRYQRPLPTPDEWRVWRVQEVICFVYLLTVLILVAIGLLHWSWVVQAYSMAAMVVGINAVRTLAAHRYRHDNDEPHTLIEQLLDSINHPNWPILTGVWAPVGLAYHALHHLFPGLPYHNLALAHKRLVTNLPADSVYHQVNSASLLASLRQLWRDSAETRRAANPPVRTSPSIESMEDRVTP